MTDLEWFNSLDKQSGTFSPTKSTFMQRIYPRENAEWASLDGNWYKTLRNRPRGVCFIVKFFNEEATLQRALDSIVRLATSIAYEIVLVDNNSTDQSNLKVQKSRD